MGLMGKMFGGNIGKVMGDSVAGEEHEVPMRCSRRLYPTVDQILKKEKNHYF